MSKRIADFKDLKNLLGRKDHHNPNDFGIDGEDHINIANISKTPIGRYLTITSNGSFEYPLIGTFDSVHALEYWLKAKGQVDEIRHTNSSIINKNLKMLNKIRVPNFKMISLMANYIRIMKRPDLIKQIKALPKDLPVLSYFVHRVSGLRMVTSYAESYIPLVNELIRAVQNDREPNYRGYLDRRYPDVTIENGFLDATDAFIDLVKPNMDLKEERVAKKRMTSKKRTQVKSASKDAIPKTIIGIDKAGDPSKDQIVKTVQTADGTVLSETRNDVVWIDEMNERTAKAFRLWEAYRAGSCDALSDISEVHMVSNKLLLNKICDGVEGITEEVDMDFIDEMDGYLHHIGEYINRIVIANSKDVPGRVPYHAPVCGYRIGAWSESYVHYVGFTDIAGPDAVEERLDKVIGEIKRLADEYVENYPVHTFKM